MSSISLQELEQRISALQSSMADRGLEAALIVQRADLYYFSGTGQDAHLLVPAEGAAKLLVRKDFERAAKESPLAGIIAVRRFSDLKDRVNSVLGGSPKTLGMELDVLPVNNYRQYEEAFPRTEIVDVSPLIRQLRMIKSAYELSLMEQAAKVIREMFEAVREILKVGMSEVEFSAEIEAFCRKRGHQGFVRVRGFNQEVFYGHIMSGANLAMPSSTVGPTGGCGLNPSFPHGAGAKIIVRHEPVQIDHVGLAEGYVVDASRTFYLGEPPAEFQKIHQVALDIQDALSEMGTPGTRAETLYQKALDMAEEAGFAEGFMGYPQPVPFVGHGVGLELDEFPLVARKSPHVLQKGMVVAIEPKFIVPSKGLAGIENTFVVTEKGLERLTFFDDALQVLP